MEQQVYRGYCFARREAPGMLHRPPSLAYWKTINRLLRTSYIYVYMLILVRGTTSSIPSSRYLSVSLILIRSIITGHFFASAQAITASFHQRTISSYSNPIILPPSLPTTIAPSHDSVTHPIVSSSRHCTIVSS